MVFVWEEGVRGWVSGWGFILFVYEGGGGMVGVSDVSKHMV